VIRTDHEAADVGRHHADKADWPTGGDDPAHHHRGRQKEKRPGRRDRNSPAGGDLGPGSQEI